MKILAALLAILILWIFIPHIIEGRFIAPNPIHPHSWSLQWDNSDYARAMATPPEGYGWRRFDFWNQPPIIGTPIQKDDFNPRKIWD